MRSCTKKIAGFNQYPQQNCHIFRPEKYHDLFNFQKPIIARGCGKSYGDCALQKDANVLHTIRLNRFISFDKNSGILTAEAGTTLLEILNLIVPQGWFLPVVPGTQLVTLGGCVANDIHGKNHVLQGSLGKHILWLELITSKQEAIRCSPQENSDIFFATIGGLGLTGIISAISIQLMPITSDYMQVKNQPAANLEELLQLFTDDIVSPYQVAWLDGFATGKDLGRGIMMHAQHAESTLVPTPTRKRKAKNKLTVPFQCPSWLLNSKLLKFYNDFYFKQQSKKFNYLSSYVDFFFPLDHIEDWNKLYGKRGFVQYQFVVPQNIAYATTHKILAKLQQAKFNPNLCVVKKFGKHEQGLLSFPQPGITVAMDIALKNPSLFKLLDELDNIVIENGGRVYLAKDARLSVTAFRRMYPNFLAWHQQKKMIDPQNQFVSSLSQRLELQA